MARSTKTAPKNDWYADVTDRIIAALEAGPGEWAKPWKSMGVNGMPRNGKSNRQYNGVNIWLLALAGYSDARWYTFNQAKELGANVRKGEKGTKIVYWQFIAEKDENGVETGKKIPLLRVFTVFNREQVEGLPADVGEAAPSINPADTHAEAMTALEAVGADVRHGGDRASYSLAEDCIRLPNVEQFHMVEHYLATRAHETIHWTGAEGRLNRDLKNRFGSDAYAMEELVAEIGAAFLCARLGVEGELQHPKYLAHWLKVLRGDKYAVFGAARAAQQAVDFILNADEGADVEESAAEAA
jgi:antirestriction protein ArdC